MKVSRILMLAAVLGGAGYGLLPSEASGFVLIGNSNDANSSGFQVNPTSFTDANANNNLAGDANFPGATGAALALWKAADEWNSELRANNGNGDPSQVGGLGSGGSNYDYMYHGTTTGSGGNLSAVIRASTSTLGAGVFAVTNITSNNGWSMIFDDSATNGWNWQDGPGNETSNSLNKVDIQGIATHELGHALGLDHTTVGGSTMFAGTSQTGSYLLRSIETDDINGVKAIYGVKSATKPHITSVAGTFQTGGTITITGTNFSATGNEVWFSKKTNGSTFASPCTPTKVTGVVSTNGGTTISVVIPANTASGDIIVHASGATSTHALKSAPFPYSVNAGPTTPQITSLSPPSISIMAIPTPVLSINGVNFTGATTVTIGTTVYQPGDFSVVNDGLISLPLNPPPLQSGVVAVQVTTAQGLSNSVNETVTMPTGHIIMMSDTTPPQGGTFIIWLGEPTSGQTTLISHAGCFGAVDLSPYFISNIGACGDWDFINPLPPPTDSRGVTSYFIQLPPTFTGLRYLQSFAIDLSNPVFPLPATNIATVNVF